MKVNPRIKFISNSLHLILCGENIMRLRRTVTILPDNDKFIRRVLVEMIKQGYGADYTKALNIVLGVGIEAIIEGLAIAGEIPPSRTLNEEALDKFANVVIETWKKLSGEIK